MTLCQNKKARKDYAAHQMRLLISHIIIGFPLNLYAFNVQYDDVGIVTYYY